VSPLVNNDIDSQSYKLKVLMFTITKV